MPFQKGERVITRVEKDFGSEIVPAGTEGMIAQVWKGGRYLVELDNAQQNHIYFEDDLDGG
jgi:hypothetical protein